jgi:type I restriction enzyme S subunit
MENDNLPLGWKWEALGALADFVNGDRGENYPTLSERVESGVPFINTGHIQPDGRLTRSGMDYITLEAFERLRSGIVRPGDILYCLRGSTIGKTGWNHYAKGAISSSLVILRAKDSRFQKFLYYYLRSPLGRQLAALYDNGSAQPNLSVRALSAYPVPVPTPVEQQAIGRILSSLEDRIELHRQMSASLQKLAAALFKYWFVEQERLPMPAEDRNESHREGRRPL